MISLQLTLGLAISGFVGLVFGFVILTFYNALGPPAALLRGDEALARQAFRRTLVLAAVIAMVGYVLYWGSRHWATRSAGSHTTGHLAHQRSHS